MCVFIKSRTVLFLFLVIPTCFGHCFSLHLLLSRRLLFSVSSSWCLCCCLLVSLSSAVVLFSLSLSSSIPTSLPQGFHSWFAHSWSCPLTKPKCECWLSASSPPTLGSISSSPEPHSDVPAPPVPWPAVWVTSRAPWPVSAEVTGRGRPRGETDGTIFQGGRILRSFKICNFFKKGKVPSTLDQLGFFFFFFFSKTYAKNLRAISSLAYNWEGGGAGPRGGLR